MRYEFATAGRIVVGPGSAAELPSLVESIGRAALVVHGHGAVVRGGPAAEAIRGLADRGLVGAVYAISDEPDVATVEAGASLARVFECDCVVGVGGGSVIDTAKAAARLGVKVVNGFTGSSVWHMLYFFPPTTQQDIDAGFADFARRWKPILDAFDAAGVRFALEVHPTEIAYDIHTARRALAAVNNRKAFGFNFDPSHLIWQGIDPAKFIDAFPDRIYHMHVKDAIRTLDGTSSILASHISFGDHRRGWDFRSPGRGEINFEEIVRGLNRANYTGPLSVEWEDSGMHREHGAREAAQFVRTLDFTPSSVAFDAAFEKKG